MQRVTLINLCSCQLILYVKTFIYEHSIRCKFVNNIMSKLQTGYQQTYCYLVSSDSIF